MTDIYNQILETNRAFIGTSSESTLRDWLLGALEDYQLAPMQMFGDPSPRVQIAEALAHCPSESKQKFKRALVRAAAEWRRAMHGLRVIRDLAYLAIDIGASDIISVLRVHIERGSIRGSDDEEYVTTMSALVAVIGGFAPIPEAGITLKRFLEAPTFDTRFAGQVTSGLCLCEPQAYPDYLPRFLKLAARNPQHFLMDHVMAEFIRLITIPVILEHLPELDSDSHDEVLYHMVESGFSDARIGVSELGNFEIVTEDGASYSYIPSNAEEGLSVNHALYQSWLKRNGKGKVVAGVFQRILKSLDSILANEASPQTGEVYNLAPT